MDLLRWPVLGPFLRWRHARTVVQLVLLFVAAIIVVHGFIGPDFAAGNLSTVLTWVHYRGLLVVALLAAGNLFCFGCPMIRVRDWGRRLHAPRLKWPAWLRGKWLAIVLFVAVLFAYEFFDLWSLPAATAYLVLAYFVAALVVDLLFTGASFCKHVCPVGQFSFVASTISPLEVRVRARSVCESCTTEDCIAGRPASPLAQVPAQRGCELGLFQPAKVGNLDCTFCLDCVQACPHDNVAIGTRVPAVELADDRRRSAIGRLSERRDLAALVVLFVFGSFLNALAMTSPGVEAERWLAGLLGTRSEAVALSALFVSLLVIAPVVLLTLAAWLSRMSGSGRETLTTTTARFAYGLAPLGFGMWLAHYGFHLLTGILVVVPVTQSATIDLFGAPFLGDPFWRWAGMRPGAVLPVELGFLTLGALGSIGVMSLIAEVPGQPSFGRALPWISLVLLLALAAGWILIQPMEMRGTGFGA